MSRGSQARYALVVLTFLNLLNYVDRYIPSAVKELFKKDLHLSDAQTSLPMTAFVLVYMVASPLSGGLVDRVSRKWIMAAGVVVWSLATAATGLATGLGTFLLARAAVGLGEAAYAALSPTLLGDLYPTEKHNRVLTFFYIAIPLGAAIGFALGGWIGARFGWRAAFWICGLPGVLTALFVLSLRDPRSIAVSGTSPGQINPITRWPQALRELRRNREYVLAVAGYTAVTFASGALADWFPAFLTRYRGLGIAEAASLVGTSAVVGGIGGTLVGGWLGDALRGRTRKPYWVSSGVAMLFAALLTGVALLATSKTSIAAAMLSAQFFLWFYNAPINTVLLGSVSSSLRPRAFSLHILCIHLLGDALSPAIVGALSDRTGSLASAMQLAPVALFVGAAIWLYGWRKLPEVTHQ